MYIAPAKGQRQAEPRTALAGFAQHGGAVVQAENQSTRADLPGYCARIVAGSTANVQHPVAWLQTEQVESTCLVGLKEGQGHLRVKRLNTELGLRALVDVGETRRLALDWHARPHRAATTAAPGSRVPVC